MLKITTVKNAKRAADTAVVCVYAANKLSPGAAALDKGESRLISAALKRQKNFSGKIGQTLVLTAAEKSRYARIVLLGLGDPAELTALSCEDNGGKLAAALQGAGAEKAVFFVDGHKGFKDLDAAQLAAHTALGAQLRLYAFDKYKQGGKKAKGKDNKDKDEKTSLQALEFVTDDAPAASKLQKRLEAVAYGVYFARDVMNEPPNMLYPDSYAKTISAQLKPLGVEVEIIDEKKMEKLGMGAALAVGQGSIRPPRMVVMRWNGTKAGSSKSKSKNKDKTGPLAFVGKGVTFDTGGISIKPSAGMDEMKMDMGGSAAVVGLMKALAMRKAKADVVAIVGLVENMPSDRAYRPGDVITSLSGQTIEVLNTDAEGRLVLADALTYIQDTYKPRLCVDLATLTGAILVALGTEYCGTFVNDDKLWQELEASSKSTGEKLWRMPLDEAYRKAMDSKVADLNNLGDAGRYAGACTAAGFLQRFVADDLPWAHIDIAGAMMQKADKATVPRGAVGFGVRILDRFVADHYET